MNSDWPTRTLRLPLRIGRRLRRECLRTFGRQSYGLNQLDVKLAAYVRKRNGFFVEAGANDGVSQNNTLYFERYRGWKGLLIEPIPELARQCQISRPQALVEQCALVAEDAPDATLEMHYLDLMSFVPGARGSVVEDDAHFATAIQYLQPGEHPYVARVPARTLTSVLDTHGIRQIDLLSLDVEGYEAQVLKGLDFTRYRPSYILVEANDAQAVSALLSPMYDHVATLSQDRPMRDELYILREDRAKAVGWRFPIN
jgi:FkbM family methyltransferase